MKLIKKIAAIMFAFMMVVSMSCNVKAEETEGVYGQHDGSITITGALQGQTYTIYEMLKLESFSGNNYSYTIADGWEDFFKEGAEGAKYMQKDENGYMSFIAGKGGNADIREFAQKALAYAQEGHGIYTQNNSPMEGKDTVEFTGLNLGYYLVGSTTGALCGLDTTHKKVEIKEKNGVPSVDKKIVQNDTDVESNFANIGDTVYFKTTITAKSGAENYILHDTMDTAFTFKDDIVVQSNGVTIDSSKYTIYYHKNNTEKTNHVKDDCTFEIRFTKDYLDTLANDQNIVVTYSAILNGDANIGRGDHNATHLTYGDNKNTVDVTTTTYTSQIKVLKYTGDTTHVLAGAKFKLFKQEAGGEALTFVKKAGNEENYRLTVQGESGIAEIVTTSSGAFTMQGLKPGVYWLEETAAPKGYNKLVKRIKVEINTNGNLIIDGKDKENGLPINQINVENKTGTVLPSTGGAGTTMIYLVGAVLVLGSGVVLVTKRRVKGK